MKLRERKQLNRKKQICNLFKVMSKIFYDIIPLKQKKRRFIRKTSSGFQLNFEVIKASIIKIIVFLLIVSLNWAGLSAVQQTIAYFNDNQESTDNIWQAGILDFELTSDNDFLPSPIEIGEETERTISIINFGNNHKYTITAINFSADVCDYLNLEVRLNDGEILYSGLLKNFVDFGSTVFEDPADWNFVLTLLSHAPDSVLGQTCDFDFVFFGSQTRHDLPFGTGFTDTEQISNSIAIAGPDCEILALRSMGYWMTHTNAYESYLPQSLGGFPDDEIIDTVEKAQGVFKAFPVPIENMLKKHLLAIKFNVAHFGIGEFYAESCEYKGEVLLINKTINELIYEADDLLRNPDAIKGNLENMKDILDCLNSSEVEDCSGSLSNNSKNQDENNQPATTSNTDTDLIIIAGTSIKGVGTIFNNDNDGQDGQTEPTDEEESVDIADNENDPSEQNNENSEQEL